jgi:hypothetical protein
VLKEKAMIRKVVYLSTLAMVLESEISASVAVIQGNSIIRARLDTRKRQLLSSVFNASFRSRH